MILERGPRHDKDETRKDFPRDARAGQRALPYGVAFLNAPRAPSPAFRIVTVACWLATVWLALVARPIAAAPDDLFQRVGFDQRLGEQLPPHARFRESHHSTVRLGDLLDGRPALLVLGYYKCPNLCGLVW